jgi:simple sugar transport system ATP-binding protein
LTVTGVTMMFGSFSALNDVSASFAPGRVHAIVGQNGAGKTTFARVVCGLYQPTAGRVLVDDTPLPYGDVIAARERGVDMVHQNFSLPPSFTVAEALHLFGSPASVRPFTKARLVEQCRRTLERYGPAVSPLARIRDLSVEARQGLEITRALSANTRVLVLDEPTAVLPPAAVGDLFERVRRLADSGVTILIVLHKLAEVWAVANTVTVLRSGQITLPTTPLSEVDTKTVTACLIGDEGRVAVEEPPIAGSVAEQTSPVAGAGTAAGTKRPAALALSDVVTRPLGHEAALDEVSLEVRGGEVVGIAGVEGNGQQGLVSVIAGLSTPVSGSVRLAGSIVTHEGLLARRRRGLRVIPFDRNTEGVSLTSPLWLNVGIGEILLGKRGWFSPRTLRGNVQAAVAKWGVKHRSLNQAAGELSGGNIQRAILAREVSQNATVLVAAQPTRGLDLAATAFVHETLRDLARRGAGVVLVSSDLDELRTVSDRIVVLRGGRAVADLAATAPLAEIGAAMVGADDA